MNRVLSSKIMHLSLMALTALPLACGGDSAGCAFPGQVADYEYPDPAPKGGAMRDDILRVRISNSLLEFFTGHMGELLGSAAGQVVEENGKKLARFVVNSGSFSGTFDLDITKLDSNTTVAFADGNGDYPASLNVTLNDMDLYANLNVSDCIIHGTDNGPLAHVDSIVLAIDIGVKTGSAGLKILDLNINDTASTLNLGINSIRGSVDGNGAACGALRVALVAGNVILSGADIFKDLFMPKLIELASDKINEAMGEVPVEYIYGFSLPEMIAGMAKIDGLDKMWAYPETFGLHVAPNRNPLRITQSGNNASSAGLSVVLDAAFGAEKSNCIADIEPPVYGAMHTTLPDYNGVVTIIGQDGYQHPENYDALLTLSQDSLAQLFFGLIRSGALCVKMDTDSLSALVGGVFSPTVGLFATLAPELSYLAPSNAPVIISLRPSSAPVVEMGTGKQIVDEATGAVKNDSIVSISFNQLELSFFLFTENRYARMFTLLMDIHAGLTVASTNDAQLGVMVDDLAIKNFVTVFNDLAPHAKLDELLESLLDMLLGSILSNNFNFNVNITEGLSALFGEHVDLFFNDIRREPAEPNPDLPGHYLAIYATFCAEEDLNNNKDLACYRAGHGGALPNASAPAAVRPAADNGLIKALSEEQNIYGFELAGKTSGTLALMTTPGYEYRFRVDNGPWLSYRRPAENGKMLIKSGLLRLPGRHNIAVVARIPGSAREFALDNLSILVDNVRPAVFSAIQNDVLHIWAEDMGSAADKLSLKVRYNDGTHQTSWQDISAFADLSAKVVTMGGALEVVASDEAGNISPLKVFNKEEVVLSTNLGKPILTEKTAGGAGCNAAGGANVALLVFLALGLLWRKKSVSC